MFPTYRPLRVMYQDEARFGRISDTRYCWDELREKYFHNRAFDSLGALKDQLVAGLRALEADHARVKSIAGWEYIINSISNAI